MTFSKKQMERVSVEVGNVNGSSLTVVVMNPNALEMVQIHM